jgi:lysophospholipase L1-like esterase
MRAVKPVTLFLAMLLAASLGANYFLYTRARLYYLQMSQLHLDPLGLTLGDTGAVPPRGREAMRVVMMGDSRAQAWRRHTLPADYLVINRGVGAQTTIQILERFDRQISLLDPDLIILEAGVNDLKMIALFPEQREKIIEDCRNNMRELVRRSVATGAKVILVTIFPRGPLPLERRPFWSSAVDSAIIDVNSSLKELASDGVTILDASFLEEDGYVRDEYAADLLHLTDAGYDALNVGLARVVGTGGRAGRGD